MTGEHGGRGNEGLLGEVLIARQPILDASLAVVAYELLHRDVTDRAPSDPAASARATASVLIDGVLGLRDHLVADDEDAHVNVPIDAFEVGTLLDLPSEGLVLELPPVPDEVAPSRQALRLHREAGFRVLLDNVVPRDPRLELVDNVDMVKVDLVGSGRSPGLELIRELRRRNVKVVAGRVESPALFDRTVAAGASLVQGFFFTRPRTVRSIRPIGLSPTHLGLLQACAAEPLRLDEVETLIRQDMTLADRFLRLVRQPGMRWRNVETIRDGLLLLGDRAVRRWVRLLVLSLSVRDSHPEVAILSAVRARHCEALQEAIGMPRPLEAFTVGMFSGLGQDGVLPAEVRAELPISDEVDAALAGKPGSLRTLLDIAMAAEQADWGAVVSWGVAMGMTPAELARVQIDALAWARRITAAMDPIPPSPVTPS